MGTAAGNDTFTNVASFEWCHEMPKVELHAHLGGSVRSATLIELAGKEASEIEEVLKVTRFSVNEWAADVESHASRLSHCFRLFDVIHRLTADLHVIERVAREVVEDFANDRVVYLELRTTPRSIGGATRSAYVDAVLAGIRSSLAWQAGSISVRLLLSIDRKMTLDEAVEVLELAKAYASDVVGLDLAGNPCVGEFKAWLTVLEHARQSGLNVTLHCGELNNEDEALAMIRFRPGRLGHCVRIRRDGQAWKELLSSKIPIEVCLTSNKMSESVPSYDGHPVKDWLAAQHPVSINTDDKGVFNTSASLEHWILAKTFGLTKAELLEVSERAVAGIFADDSEKERLRDLFCLERQRLLQGAAARL